MINIAEIEGQRFLLFMEQEGFTQLEMGKAIKKPQPTVNKYIKGKIRVPSDVVKRLHTKYKLSLNWFYLGTGNMKVKELEKKNLVTDVTDLKIEISVLTLKLERFEEMTEKLYRDFYAAKRG